MGSTTKTATPDTANGEPLGAVRERVLATLRQDIIAGRLAPGDRLVERELAERFGVSRVPVREAVRALVAEGFVHFASARRAVVRGLTPDDVRELFELREALEVYAAGLAAARATPEALGELRGLLEEAATATKAADAEAVTDINTRFHDSVLAMAGNSLLSSVMEPVDGRLRWLTRQNEDWAQLLTEHQDLYDAIASGDPGQARSHALTHVQTNYRSTVRRLFGDDGG
ncbi:GntR family transcriptional regulator [Streptomyces acidiscabies]|uniref:GntR family transcriptional regulator n=1 Tax=Streptomyces acidiscabies TaxID=42234 RepID=A0AAP6B5W9_9ACTN|nr:GntR family transcriptional regulator [Streptomyces acidiscabies]MBP5940300.1 GntR family transcriptional regulator [Streptomyces sp. LBUM 1476]MBZ3911532.1 GntR family transcriptional regulator [Streptomyces acidiscabies]MDX2958756.1 GntR family transcriptional regulator [Streptomyces acidiscabies]MDX3018194.1 GntR family transcriptional regulator [Streptomyces acidiscabies]MDX3791591.1 GntR family transcriptional regulator [Streptomyces acidiscabies]